MKHMFYDVKAKQKVETEITDKVVYGGDSGSPRYAFKGKTADGRNLTTFVSKAVFESVNL